VDARAGTTAVLRQRDDGRWDELGRTEASDLSASALVACRAYAFAAAEVLADGDLAREDEREKLRVTPLADETAPALHAVPTCFSEIVPSRRCNSERSAATRLDLARCPSVGCSGIRDNLVPTTAGTRTL
jgi:hypothetical protein